MCAVPTLTAGGAWRARRLDFRPVDGQLMGYLLWGLKPLQRWAKEEKDNLAKSAEGERPAKSTGCERELKSALAEATAAVHGCADEDGALLLEKTRVR